MEKILGIWRTDPQDSGTLHTYGDVSLDFRNDGQLIYTIHLEEKVQKIFLTYQINEDILITDQPSSPRKEETKFNISPDGKKLELNFDGIKSTYLKASTLVGAKACHEIGEFLTLLSVLRSRTVARA